MMEASRAYRELHSLRGMFPPSGLRSTYRPSEHPVYLPLDSLRPHPQSGVNVALAVGVTLAGGSEGYEHPVDISGPMNMSFAERFAARAGVPPHAASAGT